MGNGFYCLSHMADPGARSREQLVRACISTENERRSSSRSSKRRSRAFRRQFAVRTNMSRTPTNSNRFGNFLHGESAMPTAAAALPSITVRGRYGAPTADRCRDSL